MRPGAPGTHLETTSRSRSFGPWTRDSVRVDAHRGYFAALWAGTEAGVSTLSLSEERLKHILRFAADDPEERLAARAAQGIPSRRHLLATSRRQFLTGPKQIAVGSYGSQRGPARLWLHWQQSGSGRSSGAPSSSSFRASYYCGSGTLRQRSSSRIQTSCSPVEGTATGGTTGSWDSLRTPQSEPRRRVVIAVINTATSAEFLSRLHQGASLLVVVDEVHTAGAVSFSRVLEVDAGGRMDSAPPRSARVIRTAQRASDLSSAEIATGDSARGCD